MTVDGIEVGSQLEASNDGDEMTLPVVDGGRRAEVSMRQLMPRTLLDQPGAALSSTKGGSLEEAVFIPTTIARAIERAIITAITYNRIMHRLSLLLAGMLDCRVSPTHSRIQS